MYKSYYHIAEEFLGQTVILEPRIPFGAVITFENVTTPRVCFAPSVYQCLMALAGIDSDKEIRHNLSCYKKQPTIYVTNKKLVPAGRVYDKKRTGEMWSKKPIEARYYGTLDVETFVETGIILFSRLTFS